MSEEQRMDKKSHIRSAQPQSRALGVDCKKNSELTNKPWPRQTKKREGPGGSSKYEPYRKNAGPSKGRGQVDKRPRARGATGFVVGGVEVTGIAEDEPEVGSVFVPGNKKQNLNHLLNFVYAPRGASRRDVPSQRHHHNQQRTLYHPHSEHLYLQASCQFVVKKDGDYSTNLADPDVPIKWDQIEEIVVRSPSRLECPICLGCPAAGRVGRCGHVYCWPCALHYAAAHDRSPPPCPVCMAPLRVDAMKPARYLRWNPPSHEVCMRLVRRVRGTAVVELAPARGSSAPDAPAILAYEHIERSPYCKLFAADKNRVKSILDREKKELHEQLLQEIDTTEIVYFEQALSNIDNQLKKLDDENYALSTSAACGVQLEDNVPLVYEKHTVSEKKIDWFDVTEESSTYLLDATIDEQIEDLASALDKSDLNPEADEFTTVDVLEGINEFPLVEDVEVEEAKSETNNILTDADKENQTKYFYFYQAEDGQQLFLHGVNVRMLCASWGALVAAPPLLRGTVLRRETASLTHECRKRMPCTAHLPLHCPFEIVELDLQPPYVTHAAMNTFSEELERRARARARLEREDRRRERAWRRAAEGPPRPDVTSARHFPPAASSAPLAGDLPPLPSTQPPSTPSPSPSPSPSSSGLSFAKMASTSGTWRVRAPRPATPPSPPPPLEEELPAAPRALSLSDAIEAALHAAPAAAAPKTKKKSKQKVLLFATGMQRTP